MGYSKRILCGLLVAGLLIPFVGCTGTQSPASDTTEGHETADATDTLADSEESTEESVEKPPRDVYEDLSSLVPAYTDSGKKSVTVSSDGKGETSRIRLDFTKHGGEYVISSTKVVASCHDVATCDTCGYVDIHGDTAYLLSSHGKDQGGVTITVATPILASSVKGMTLTFKTTAEASTSSMRILPKDQTNNAAFINSCGSMSGATKNWVTVDLGVKDYAELADSDGYIRSFQMYFRNKNKTDCYVQSVEFTVSPDKLLIVDEVAGNCFFRSGATEAIASVIADRFTAADIRAEITVDGSTYRKNTSSTAGSLKYRATVTLPDGTVVTKDHTAVIPAITGAWLDATDGAYGSSHDAKDQWQDTFDPSGLLFLKDNSISCAEGLKTVEYAVVKSDVAYHDGQTVWRAPQLLELSDGGLSCVLINSFLDLGDQLEEGSSYRLLVRGVTQRDNYILHVDIPFVYQPLSVQASDALKAARLALEQASVICSAETEKKADYLRDQFKAWIGNESVAVDVEILGEGLGSVRARVILRYTPAITEARLPDYALNGTTITDVYNYVGEAFTKEALTVKYSEEQSVITLISPYDGDSHVILAADVIYNHAKAPLSVVENVNYGYLAGEHCTPPPVTLTWTDQNAAEGKTYTVLISTDREMKNPMVFTAAEPCLQVYNLNIGTTYYWQVRSDTDASPVQVFATEDGYPRFLKLDGVSNVRDIGGYLTADGCRVKQNLAYRSAHLDAISADAKEIALNTLNIRTDLDLRGGSSTPLGSSVQHISIAMQWYEHIFEEDMYGVVRQTVSTFAYEENYPIIFHCSMGRDRTGTTAFLILGLLGVEEEALRREYYSSFFSQQGAFSESEFPLLIINMSRLVEGFNSFGDKDDTLQEKIQSYLLHIGVTEQEIQSIKDIWLE
jgi:hypothetical protein